MKDLEGFEELEKAFGNAAQALSGKELSQISKTGADMVLRAERAAAPSRNGDLREGLILHKEKSRYKGKSVYDVMPDPKKNNIFQKPIKNPVRSKSAHGYYPASQEYGFFTRRPDGGMTYVKSDGSSLTMDKVPGKHYLLAAAESTAEAATAVIVEGIQDIVEREFKG